MAYTCITCGVTAETPGHLCSPCDQTFCGFCGTQKADGRHVCWDNLETLHFFCTTCGRVASKQDSLCSPSPIVK